MAITITFEKVSEMIGFLNGFDGAGLVVTDEDELAREIKDRYYCYTATEIPRSAFLIDDYELNEYDEDYD